MDVEEKAKEVESEKEETPKKKKATTQKTPKVATPIFKVIKARKNKRQFILQDEDEESEEIIVSFKKPPFTFEKNLQQLKESGGMGSFRYFKYASMTREQKIMIEESLLVKMAKWKYDPSELKSEVTKNILAALIVHWDKATKLEKEIREQTLR